MRHRIWISALILPFTIHRPAHAAIIPVPGSQPTIQAGIDAARDGDTVLIADGAYSGPGNFDLHWSAFSKHLVIRSANGPLKCIVDCRSRGRAFLLNAGQDDRDIIRGLTLTNGYVFHKDTILTGGGAILCDSTSPLIVACLLIHNVAGDTIASAARSYWTDGGAIECVNRAAPTIRGNRIVRNFANHTGGGIHFNDGTSGIVENNVIDHNENNGCYGGGGIALVGGANPLIVGNQITYNTTRYYWKGGFGGGIICLNANPTILYNTIAFNTTVNGDSIGEGGGLRIRGLPSPIIEGNIIWNNVGAKALENLDFQYAWFLDIHYSNVGGGADGPGRPSTAHNTNADPMFLDPAAGDFRLGPNSPCINAGPSVPKAGLPVLDAAGKIRIAGGLIDLGAYESLSTSSITPATPSMTRWPIPEANAFDLRGRKLKDASFSHASRITGLRPDFSP